MLPAPQGEWGMPDAMLKSLAGYGDVNKNQAEGRAIMEKLGYSAAKPLKVKVATRNMLSIAIPQLSDRSAQESSH